MLRGPGLAVNEISDVTLEIAMLVTLGYARAFHRTSSAFFHAAIAGHGNVATRSVGSRHQLPPGSSAQRAIFKSHFVGVGLQPGAPAAKHTSGRAPGQAVVLGKLWKGLARARC